MGKDSDDLLGIILAILGAAALIKALEKECPYCSRKIVRGTSTCPYCGAMV